MSHEGRVRPGQRVWLKRAEYRPLEPPLRLQRTNKCEEQCFASV
jgi:hypothetical protein